MENGADVIRTARAINPHVRVMARGSYLRDVSGLRGAGADIVFAGEGEVAMAFVESVLRRLGATAEQIDRERTRARADLFGGSG
jgi:CPA2 family monovalent cation:H+ antiporter-2